MASAAISKSLHVSHNYMQVTYVETQSFKTLQLHKFMTNGQNGQNCVKSSFSIKSIITFYTGLIDIKIIIIYSKDIRFFLNITDFYRKYDWVTPLKKRNRCTVVKALNKILTR